MMYPRTQSKKSADWHLVLFAACGVLGSLLFSDEFDDLRLLMLCGLALPCFTIVILLRSYNPKFFRLWPLSGILLHGISLLCFAWGVLMLVNSLGYRGTEKVQIQHRGATVPVDMKRGSLGLLYKKRW